MGSELESSWVDYEHVNTVVVQGTTVVLARESPLMPAGWETIEHRICFNVLAAPDGNGAAPEWVGFRKLLLPNQLLPAGMEIVRVLTRYADNQYLIPVTDAGGRFRAVPFGESIYIFRLSTDGTLLSTRFRLIREGSTATPDRVSYLLESPWEVKFPATDQGVPVYEPTFELSMVRGLPIDSFDVEIVPQAEGRAECQVLQLQSDGSRTLEFSLPMDERGQYCL